MKIDANLYVGACPFRDLPSRPRDLLALRRRAGIDRAVATGFHSLFYHDPAAGLARDLADHRASADWLAFHAVVNPDFPQLDRQLAAAAGNPRVAGLRLFPTIHRFSLASTGVRTVLLLAAQHNLPVNLAGRRRDLRVAPIYLQQQDPKPDEVRELVEQAPPGVKIVLSMFFFGELAAMKLNWRALPNLYVDVGCCKPSIDSFDRLPTWLPPERALFGSGAPLYYWQGSRLAVEGARLTEDQKQRILGGTAEEVYRWA